MGRREQNKQIKREAMLRAGLNAFLQVGYERASIEQIVSEAGVARGTFYLYYADKLALFEALVDAWFEPMVGLFEDIHVEVSKVDDWDSLWEIYRGMGTAIAWIGLANRDEVLLSFRESRSAGPAGDLLRAREQQLVDAAVAYTQTAMERGLIDVPDPRLTVLVILGACERLFFEVLSGKELGDIEQISATVVGLFEGALKR